MREAEQKFHRGFDRIMTPGTIKASAPTGTLGAELAAVSRNSSNEAKRKDSGPQDYLRRVLAHEARSPLLKKLLDDPRMRAAWRELASRVTSENQWLSIWYGIKNADFQSRHGASPERRGAMSKLYRTVSDDAAQLARALRNSLLDMPVYNLLPADVLHALSVNLDEWASADSLKKSDIAHSLLRAWPTVSEILEALAIAASEGPPAFPYRRAKGRVRERIFVWHLRSAMRQIVKADLNGTVAAITSVIFNKPVTKEFVRSVGGT